MSRKFLQNIGFGRDPYQNLKFSALLLALSMSQSLIGPGIYTLMNLFFLSGLHLPFLKYAQ